MSDLEIIAEQKAWIESGKIGCVFASALVKISDKIGWHFQVMRGYAHQGFVIESNTYIASLIFPGKLASHVLLWSLANKFYLESIDELYQGLRIKMTDGIAWVQYFGPDSHVKTRQAPHPMLSFTCKLPAHVYAKTMAVGILHLAHASIEHLTSKKCDTLWNQSIEKTSKELGHPTTIREAAKVTFEK